MTVRNDATRRTVRPEDGRRTRSVVARQGQVLLDADLDHQSDALLDRVETGTDDALGSPSRFVVPAGSGGFAVTAAAAPADVGLGEGHGYQRGWLVENASPATVGTQPHPRTDDPPETPYALVVKALVRHVDPVEEPAWADPALGDAQASGRALVDWQVFPFVPAGGWGTTPECSTVTDGDGWQRLVAPSTGTLAVVANTAPPASDPCSLVPDGGYSRAENLLYRIEVHGGVSRPDRPDVDGPRYGLDGLKIKMSRRNASVMARIVAIDALRVTVTPPALDPLNWFAPGTYAEVVSVHDDVDPRHADGGERLFRVASATDTVVTLENASKALLTALDPVVDDPARKWFLRLWDAFADGSGTVTVSTATDPARSQHVDLGDGLGVRLGAGTDPGGTVLRRGDHWTFAARADGTVDWPAGGTDEPPHGPEIRYAPLAVVVADGAGEPVVEDCRIPLATLTDRTLHYRGGDGQEVPATPPSGLHDLPSRLRVAVLRGRTPVAGAAVVWGVPPGDPDGMILGQQVGSGTEVTVRTDAAGLCEVPWSIEASLSDRPHRVQARLVGPNGTDDGPPVVFTAGFRTAANTSYLAGDCRVLADATTVQEALDELCRNLGTAAVPDTLRVTSIRLLDRARFPRELVDDDLILTGLEVRPDAFVDGINIGITGPMIGTKIEETDPVVEVFLDLPYPATDPDRIYWAMASRGPDQSSLVEEFGQLRIRLSGSTRVTTNSREQDLERGLLWRPSTSARTFLETMDRHRAGSTIVEAERLRQLGWRTSITQARAVCLLRVRSAHVWSTDRGDPERRIYLNAEHLGTSADMTGRELLLSDRDPRRAADLDVYFYLKVS